MKTICRKFQLGMKHERNQEEKEQVKIKATTLHRVAENWREKNIIKQTFEVEMSIPRGNGFQLTRCLALSLFN